MTEIKDFNYRYFEWCIEFRCHCNETLTIDDNDYDSDVGACTVVCDACGRKYSFKQSDKIIKEVANNE